MSLLPMLDFRKGRVVRCNARTLVTRETVDGKVVREWTDPLDALNYLEESVKESPGGRWAGYLSYELGRLFEKLPVIARDDLELPLFQFGFFEGDEQLVDRPSPPSASLGAGLPSPGVPFGAAQGRPGEGVDALRISQWTFNHERYEAAVARIMEYIRAGDVFQVNLSQRFTAKLERSAREIYSRLPEAKYGAYLEFDDVTLLSNSPELFLEVRPCRRIINRPIKGTRPKLPGMDEQLLESEKDRAELNMIIDLQRNDLGRVCQIGSVQVTDARSIEEHPTVYHTAATIEGKLRDDVRLSDLLAATFPCGSVTGAPKIRAMEIIEELEPVRRGPYCGAIGYIASDGSMKFNVAIRTMIAKDGLIHIPVGGGVVADSDPAEEYEETLVKARAMFNALGIRATG